MERNKANFYLLYDTVTIIMHCFVAGKVIPNPLEGLDPMGVPIGVAGDQVNSN